MTNVQHHTWVLLSHTHQTKVTRLVVGGKETDEILAVEKNQRTPPLEELKEVRSSWTTEGGTIATTSRLLEEVTRKGLLWVQYQDHFITVEPAVPLVAINRAQRSPKLMQRGRSADCKIK